MDATDKPGASDPAMQLVAIVGGSCAGKTWLAERLQAGLGGRAERISLDDFYRDCSHLHPSRRKQVNFDHPRAIDWEELEKVIRRRAAQEEARAPRYNFEFHSREKAARPVRPKPILIMDGLWLLRRKSIRKYCCLSIFIECSARERVQRRIERDGRERGRDERSVREQWKTVAPMHEKFVAPQVKWADLVLQSPITEAGVAEILNRIKLLAKGEKGSYDRP